jgi:hypothetical protein
MTAFRLLRTKSWIVASLAVRLGNAEQSTDGWRDKSSSPHISQATDVAWLRTGASVGSRAARKGKASYVKHLFGTEVLHVLEGCPR